MEETPIKVFLIEDNEDDAMLIRRLLTAGQNIHIDVEVAEYTLPIAHLYHLWGAIQVQKWHPSPCPDRHK